VSDATDPPQEPAPSLELEIERLANLYERWKRSYEICLIIDRDGTRSWKLIEPRKEFP